MGLKNLEEVMRGFRCDSTLRITLLSQQSKHSETTTVERVERTNKLVDEKPKDVAFLFWLVAKQVGEVEHSERTRMRERIDRHLLTWEKSVKVSSNSERERCNRRTSRACKTLKNHFLNQSSNANTARHLSRSSLFIVVELEGLPRLSRDS